MPTHLRFPIFALLLAGSAILIMQVYAQQPDDARRALPAPKLILIIGDGMDDQQITIARNYLVGSAGRLTLDGLPFRAAIQVLTVDENNPTLPVYVADSANTATSIATGAVTSAGRIATTPGSDEDLVTIMELAHAAGLGTGIVTTASLTDATPASFAAHVNERFCQGPTDMVGTLGLLNMRIDCSGDYKSNGGRGSIAEQLAASDIDVLLGGGARYFEQFAEGTAEAMVIDMAVANGYEVLHEREELGRASGSGKWLGLFSRDTMPVLLRGQNRGEAEPVARVDGQVRLPEPFGCEPNPDFEGLPTLAEMTRSALRLLGPLEGFILMVESASIDKQSHLRRPCGSIGELAQLDEALGVALEYTASHPETLILVTADHSHAAQIVSDTGEFLALNIASPGHFARVLTPEGAIMGINYATNDSSIQEYHTGAQIPLYAAGPGTESLPAFMHQTELFSIMARHLRLRRDAVP